MEGYEIEAYDCLLYYSNHLAREMGSIIRTIYSVRILLRGADGTLQQPAAFPPKPRCRRYTQLIVPHSRTAFAQT
jgi:hypothetical protein